MDKVDRLIQIVRILKEEGAMMAAPPTNNASSGAIKGLPPESPPVNLKKKKHIYLGMGSRKRWMRPK
jgi:hypothetical protein